MEEKKLQKEEVNKVAGGVLGFGKKNKPDKKYNFTTHSGKNVKVTEKKDATTGRIIRVRTLGK
mgnify:CR=1 FL=1